MSEYNHCRYRATAFTFVTKSVTMKKNTKIIMAISAGLAVAGITALLLTKTDKGKKLTQKLKTEGEELAHKVLSSLNGKKKMAETEA